MGERRPIWPDDILFLPVASQDAERPKGPDQSAIPGTWSPDGEGCVSYDDIYDRRWGIVDVDVPGYRLLIVDLDVHKMDDEAKQKVIDGLEKAPNTRIHESQSGGLHVFYWLREDELTDPRCPQCDTAFDSAEAAEEHGDQTDHHVNEGGKLPVQLAGKIDDKLNGYVLSTHCEGYEADTEREPAEISVKDLPDEWIKQQDERDGPVEHDSVPEHHDSKDVGAYDIVTRTAHPEDERVPHPYHGSETGANFMVDAGGETWRCWRHQCTGNALHLFGVREGIIDCGEWDKGGLSTEKWHSILEAAEDGGLIEPTDFDPDERQWTAVTLEDREFHDSIEDVTFPTDRSFVLDKPPREGGSYAMAKHFIQKGDPLLVLSSRHHILQAHTETIADLLDPRQCVAHLEGKQRACDHSGEDQCPNRPEGQQENLHRVSDVRDLVHKRQSLTSDDAPDDLCPYWFLKVAARYADVIVTVPQLFHSVVEIRDDPDSDLVVPPSEMNLMIDEEQTLDFFWPGSIDIAEIVRSRETDGTVTVEQQNTTIQQQAHVLRKVMADVEDEQDRRAEKAEEEDRDWQRKSGEILIENSLQAADAIMDAIGTTEIRAELEADGESPSLSSAVDLIEERLEDVSLPDPNAQAETLLAHILEYCAPYFWRDEEDPSGTLESLAFPYGESPFDFKRTARDAYTLRLIGDKERTPFYADEIAEFKQIGVIAGPEGERFLDNIDLGWPAKAIAIEEFRYADDFLVAPVMKEVDDEGTPESVGKQRDRVEQVSQYLNERSQPHISVTGTKEQAADLSVALTKESSDVIGDPQSPTSTLYKLWSAGHTAIIYENSVVSRGIDAPIFDVTTIVSPGFATPYWEAKKRRWKGEDSEKYRSALATEMELKARELTNAALRMSTTRDFEEDMGSKIIVVPDSDATRLKYLQHRTLPRFQSAKRAADLVDNLAIGGGHDITISDIREGVDSSEGDLMSVLLRETIEETWRDRPAYALGETQSWIDNRYVTQTGVTEPVYEKLDPDEGQKTEEVVSSISGYSAGKARACLRILERKGRITSFTGKSGGGRPPKLWKR